MTTPAEHKKPLGTKAPQGAVSFMLWRIEGTNGKRTKLRGEPLNDGSVPDSWPVAEFSAAKVLETWGEGKYRVDWYDNTGMYMKGKQQHFEVATPASKGGPRLRNPPRGVAAPATPAATIDAPQNPGSYGGAPAPPMGIMEMLALLREERQEATERERANNERQMTWMTTMLQLMKPSGSAVDPDLLRRELAQTMREEQFKLRQQLAANAAIEDEPEEDEPEDGPPQDIDEAVTRIGTAILSDFEARAPDFVQQAVPKLANWLQRQIGTPAVPRTVPTPNGHANGS